MMMLMLVLVMIVVRAVMAGVVIVASGLQHRVAPGLDERDGLVETVQRGLRHIRMMVQRSHVCIHLISGGNDHFSFSLFV